MSITEQRSSGPLAQVARFLARKGRRVWALTVSGKRQLTPNMVRVTFTGDDLQELMWRRGQDLVLEFPQGRRHYTIRNFDGTSLAIDFVLHGASPAGEWVRGAKTGDRIDAAGPRGHTYVRPADWHLLIGDETCIPAIFAMLEGLSRSDRAFVFLESPTMPSVRRSKARPQYNSSGCRATARRPVPATFWPDAVDGFVFPQGLGHAYIIGETHNVRAVRQRLIARGLGKDQCSAEGYWRPGRVGGHDHA